MSLAEVMSVEMADHLRKEVRVQFASEAVIYWLDTELLSDIGERGDGGLTADGQPEDTMTHLKFTRRGAASYLLLPPHQQPHLSEEDLKTVA